MGMEAGTLNLLDDIIFRNISQEGLNLISQNNLITDRKILLEIALNTDLKDIGSPVLRRKSNRESISEVVLQIQKIRNVAAPKANEESAVAPRMLKLTLTDGVTFLQAIEIANIPFISREKTPPGSKILVRSGRIQNGFLLLDQHSIKLLGGKVPHLYEKWELAKSVQHHSRTNASEDGPPAWVNFGFKISNLGNDLNSPDKLKNENNSKEVNNEFENSRKDAIAEATTGAVKKVFGAGAKLVQGTPRTVNNKPKFEDSKPQNKFKKDSKIDKELLPPQKPSDKVSLFDFLENKLLLAENSVGVKYKKEDNERNNQKLDTEKRKNTYNSYYSDKTEAPQKAHVNDSEVKNYSESYRHHNYAPHPKHNNSVNYNAHKPSSFRKEFQNPSGANFSNSHHHGQKSKSKEVASTDEILNASNLNSLKEKTSNVKQKNAFIEKLSEPVKNKVEKKQHEKIISRRNNEEKMNDDWHYRAPNINDYQVQNGSSNDAVASLAENVNKLSISGEFASRSLRQHLNLQGKRPNASQNHIESNRIAIDSCNFNVGSDCLAKYWEDNKFYPARITASTETTYVVQFKGYGNVEEVLKSDCLSLEQNRDEKKKTHYGGTLEFRRSNRKFAKS